MRFTKEHLEAAKSTNGGWSLGQLRCLGLKKFSRGWAKKLLGRDFSDESIRRFIELKDAHLVNGYNVFQRRKRTELDEEFDRVTQGL